MYQAWTVQKAMVKASESTLAMLTLMVRFLSCMSKSTEGVKHENYTVIYHGNNWNIIIIHISVLYMIV